MDNVASKAEEERPTKWYGQSTSRKEIPLGELRDALPEFELRTFGKGSNSNPYMRQIVRLAFGKDNREIPVSAVSDRYALIQHKSLASWLSNGVEEFDSDDDELVAQVIMSEFGERIKLIVPLKKMDRVPVSEDLFEEPNLNIYRPEIEIVNSVDKTLALSIRIRWRRLICLNGMFTYNDDRLRLIHNLDWMSKASIPGFIKDRMSKDSGVFAALELWKSKKISPSQVLDWAEERLRNDSKWTVGNSARVYSIVSTGYCGRVGKVVGRKAHLSEYTVSQDEKVPGLNIPLKNAYDLAQMLTWIASDMHSVEMQDETTEDVPRLVEDFLNYSKKLQKS